jgi:hydroxylamine reductase
MGVCGKDNETALLQDLLVHAAKGIAMVMHRAGVLGVRDREIDRFIVEMLFTTVTNVNFDPIRIEALLGKAGTLLERAKSHYQTAAGKAGQPVESLGGAVQWKVPANRSEMLRQAEALSIAKKLEALGPDVTGLQELIVYGLKGMAAYADHAMILGLEDDQVYDFFYEALDFLTGPKATDVDALVAMAMKVGQVNLTVMGLLDKANTDTYGHPEPSVVRITPKKGKAILVSGHDLKDLEELLKQTAGKGINVYTHGEMLPCNAYPKLKKYPHLAGNYGGAWQDQQKEFDAFPGAIVMTTNCIQKPRDSYKNRIFTCGLVAWPGVVHIKNRDFTPVIEAALAQPGFTEDAEEKTITIGFGRNAVMSVADKVIEAVKAGKIRHFFLVGGCDGAKPGRNYYTEFAQQVPDDCVILTLACGKYRFNKLPFGDIDGIPRLLDVGQCNDAYSAIQIAVALANAFECDVNDLPLTLVLSWYEQKAVCILLTLLHLGIRNMRLGPTLPAFIGPNVLNVLVEKFNIAPISTPQEDLKAMLAG